MLEKAVNLPTEDLVGLTIGLLNLCKDGLCKDRFTLTRYDGPRVEDIVQRVCSYCGVTEKSILFGGRKKKYVRPRHIAIYLMRSLLHFSYTDLAERFKKDHSTMIYAYQKVEASGDLKKDARDIAESLGYKLRKSHRAC